VTKPSRSRDERREGLDPPLLLGYNRRMDGDLIRKLFLAAGVVVILTGLLIAFVMPADFACGPERAGACDATLPMRIGFGGAGVAGGMVLAALGIWLERYRR
jgi:hypothetical protein